jgi:putative ABC transport system permease protein
MSWSRRLARRIRALFRRDAIDRELGEEMRLHLALEAEEIARTSGVLADEARRRALVGFGGVARYQEEHRDARGIRWLELTLRDLRHAARGLRRSPGFTLSAVAVLALGIGSTTAVFSAVNAVLRNPKHDDLAVIFFRGFPSLSTVDFRAIEEQQRSFAAVGAMRAGEAAFRAGGEPERVDVARVTSGFFRAIGVRAAAGRLIEPRDEPVGADPVAVLSHALAARALGGAAAAIGRSVSVDGVAHTVIGVLPPSREMLASRADVWPALQLAQPQRRGPFGTVVIARLAPGATFASATRDVAGISERVFPLWSPGWSDRSARYEAVPIRTAALGDSARMLRIFAAAVALVLLIGVANVASLMLVRAIGRSREVSLRAVLGASRGQLVRLFVTESALLSVAGAVAGIAVGMLGLRALIALGPQMPGLTGARLDGGAALFAAALAVVAGLVVGTYPVALLFRKGEVRLSSGDRAIGGGRGTRATRSAFVVAQFALALPLLAISGLLLISFVRLQRVDPGFDPRNMLTVRVSLPAGQYGNDTTISAYWARALPRVREIAGVREVGLGSSMPPDDFGSSNDNFNLIDRPVAPGAPEPSGPWPSANAEYFAALGVRLLEGRLFLPTDSATRPVIVVSRSWVQKHYPGESPLGKTMVRGGCTECPLTTVVGVVDDVRYSGLAGPLDAMYSPLTQGWPRTLFLYVRTSASPAELATPVREALRSVDASVPLDDVASMEERLYASVAQPRQWATLLGAFAATALGLAAVGVFGMLSYMVSARRREIGVRMALGAGKRSVVQMVVRSGLTHALVGSALGLVAALVGTRALTNLLYDVSPGDPGTLALATLALLAVGFVACWLPARRAAAIDPLEAIRHE